MDMVEKDLENRMAEIQEEVKQIFEKNMKITDWNVPEADDNKAADMIVDILQDALNEIKKDIRAGKYDFY